MAFGTQISRKYYPVLEQLIQKHIIRKSQQPVRMPQQPGAGYINFEHIWLEKVWVRGSGVVYASADAFVPFGPAHALGPGPDR